MAATLFSVAWLAAFRAAFLPPMTTQYRYSVASTLAVAKISPGLLPGTPAAAPTHLWTRAAPVGPWNGCDVRSIF